MRNACRLFRHDDGFVFGQGVDGGSVQIQVGRDEVRRHVRQPFGEGEILIVIRLEHFQEFQVRGAGVFDVVRQRFKNVADVAGFEVHGARAAAGGEDGHAAFA